MFPSSEAGADLANPRKSQEAPGRSRKQRRGEHAEKPRLGWGRGAARLYSTGRGTGGGLSRGGPSTVRGGACRGRRSRRPLKPGLVRATGSSGVARSQENLDRPCSEFSSQKMQQDPGALSLQFLICEASLALGASDPSWGHWEPSPAGPGEQAAAPGHLLHSHKSLGHHRFPRSTPFSTHFAASAQNLVFLP